VTETDFLENVVEALKMALQAGRTENVGCTEDIP
jgi:hypothetical protein